MLMPLLRLCALSRSVLPDSLQPSGLQPARLLCSWDFPGRNPGVGYHFLLQGIFWTQGLNPRLLHLLRWQSCLPLSNLQYCDTYSHSTVPKVHQGPDSHTNFDLHLSTSIKGDIVFKRTYLSTVILLLLAQVYLPSQRAAHLRSPKQFRSTQFNRPVTSITAINSPLEIIRPELDNLLY